MIIYLGAPLLVRSCGSLGPVSYLYINKKLTGPSAALHTGKDLAVSPDMLPYRLLP